MRGVSKDVINTAFTLVFALGVIAALYFMGTEIFKRGSKVEISAFEAGGCTCVDAVQNIQIDCGGQKQFCNPCAKKIGSSSEGVKSGIAGCTGLQDINMEPVIPYPVKKIRVCTHSNARASIYADNILIGATDAGADKCVDKEFSEARKIQGVQAFAIGSIDRLTVFWEKTER